MGRWAILVVATNSKVVLKALCQISRQLFSIKLIVVKSMLKGDMFMIIVHWQLWKIVWKRSCLTSFCQSRDPMDTQIDWPSGQSIHGKYHWKWLLADKAGKNVQFPNSSCLKWVTHPTSHLLVYLLGRMHTRPPKSWVLAAVLNLTNRDGSYFTFQWILLAFLQLGSAVVKISWPSGKCVVENYFQWLLSLVANCIPRKTFNEICEGSVRTRGHQHIVYHKWWSDMVSIAFEVLQ